MSFSYEVTRVVKFIVTKVEWWLQGLGEEKMGDGELQFNDIEFLFCKMKTVLEMAGGYGSTM